MAAEPPRVSSGQVVSVLADDLTGATDSVLQFRTAGWAAYLLLTDETPADLGTGTDAVALSRSLDTRAMPRAEAAAATERAVAEQLELGTDRLYLKVDSTVRGSIAGQVDGALAAWQRRYDDALVVVCPAYPRMGRTVLDGQVLVHGEPVDQSAAGFDPVTPVVTADLAEIVGDAVAVSNEGTASELAERLTRAASGSRRVVVDAADDEDLTRLAQALESLGRRAVSVGSAGLARHLADVWLPGPRVDAAVEPGAAPVGPVVVSMTSLNEVSLEQADHLLSTYGDRLVHREIDPAEMDDPHALRAQAERLIGDQEPQVVLLQPSRVRVRSKDQVATARAIAQGMAATVGALVDRGTANALVLVGGDGAEATLAQLQAGVLQVLDQAAEGVPLCRVVSGPAAGTTVATKAGGFGSASTLTDVVNAILTKETTS